MKSKKEYFCGVWNRVFKYEDLCLKAQNSCFVYDEELTVLIEILHKLVATIASDEEASHLLYHKWYMNDGVVAGTRNAVARVIAIIKEQGSHLGLFIKDPECELFSKGDMNSFPVQMKRSNTPNLVLLGAPIGDLIFCAKFIANLRCKSHGLLSSLALSHAHTPAQLAPGAARIPGGSKMVARLKLIEAGAISGSAAAGKAEVRKHNANDPKCRELGWVCIPLAVESYGCWGEEAHSSFSRLAARLALQLQCSKSKATTTIYQRLNLTLVRCNARAMLSRARLLQSVDGG
eukprot:Em0010g699a